MTTATMASRAVAARSLSFMSLFSYLVMNQKAGLCEDAEARGQPSLIKRRQIIHVRAKSQRRRDDLLREVHLLSATRGYIELQRLRIVIEDSR